MGARVATLLAVVVSVAIGGAALAQARREGSWSWRRFGVTILVLVVLGGAVGLAVSAIGRRIGPGHPLLLTSLAVVVIFGGVFALALGLRRPRRP
jgi:hypothetical protein